MSYEYARSRYSYAATMYVGELAYYPIDPTNETASQVNYD